MATISETIAFRCDCTAVARLLAELAEPPSEIRDALLRAFEAGEELFLLETDDLLTRRTGEMLVRLKPTDRLLGLLAAAGAGN